MGRKYIIFRADWDQEQGANERLLSNGAITDILAEHFDSSESPLPNVGYRLRDYHHIERFADPNFPRAATHSQVGDWVVSKTVEYTPGSSEDIEAVIICYCRYSPITTPLEPLPGVQSPELQEA